MKPSKKGRIIAFIAEFTDQHGFSPTDREIAEGLGYASVSTVYQHITALKEKGLICETDGKSRSLVLVNGIHDAGQSNPEEQHVCLKTFDGGSLFLTYVMREGSLEFCNVFCASAPHDSGDIVACCPMTEEAYDSVLAKSESFYSQRHGSRKKNGVFFP